MVRCISSCFTEEYEDKRKELESVANPIISGAYGAAGGAQVVQADSQVLVASQVVPQVPVVQVVLLVVNQVDQLLKKLIK